MSHAPAKSAPPESAPLVLVIDDDAAIAASLSVVLRAKGYAVVTAADGASGLAQYRAHRPKIVITDIMMPGSLGLDTIARIRDSDAEVLIIAMSGSIAGGPASLLDQAHGAGADIGLNKPFEIDELLDALARYPKAPVVPPAIKR